MRTFLLIFLFISHLHSQEEYQFGDGIQVGAFPLFIGGYFSLEYEKKDNSTSYIVDDIAFLIYGGTNKFSYVSELEFKELYVHTKTNNTRATQKDENLYIERLYLDYNHNENYLFRLGKYNSPIGFWNLLPVNVLRETTSSPISTSLLFPKFTTGLYSSFTRYEEEELQVDFMLQHNEAISDDYNNYEVDIHYGIGLIYTVDDYAFKFNAGYFEESELNLFHYYALFSAKYEEDNYQIITEIGTQSINQEHVTNHAAYIQGLYRFAPQHIGILRLEVYDDKAKNIEDSFAVLAYTYRPLYPIALKAEYQAHSIESENQFLASLSVMF